LTEITVNGSGNGARSGAQTLALLATPLNSHLLRALSQGPKRQADLRREVGTPAQTTLRAHLKELAEIGSIAKQRRNRFPGVLEFELTEAGRDLLAVATILERWLERAPEGPLSLGTAPAKSAIKALAEGWSTTILRALAAGPLSLTELDHIIGSLSYPSLERRMGAMRLADQIEARPSNGRGTPYAVTPWLRQGVGPLAAATRWERCHLPEGAPPLTRIDTEAAFLLAVPLLQLPSDLSGSCRMAMEIPNGSNPRLAGVVIEVRDGKVTSCATRLRGSPEAWASGSTKAWLAALIEADSDGLELGGDGRLARTFLHGLHRSLFGLPRRKSEQKT
jgi:DNA-binding HxlR family transcriptional regulator